VADEQEARITIRTTQFLIEGRVYTGGRAPGLQRRLSDVLNEEPPFIVLKDVVVKDMLRAATIEPERHETFILSKADIVYAIPFD
jgi:hypothetical protein